MGVIRNLVKVHVGIAYQWIKEIHEQKKRDYPYVSGL